jgi:hypothetical protein
VPDPHIKKDLTDFVLDNFLFGATQLPGDDDGLVERGTFADLTRFVVAKKAAVDGLELGRAS